MRKERLIARNLKLAAFRELKTLDDFDWRFNPSLKRKPIYDLAAGHFIRERRDVLLIGPPGVGKSHLAQAIGCEAIKQGFLVLDRFLHPATLIPMNGRSCRLKDAPAAEKPDLPAPSLARQADGNNACKTEKESV